MNDKVEVYKAIAAITGELAQVGIGKNNSNRQQGFNYRSIDQVYAALAPLLSKNNLCILPVIKTKEVSERTSAKGGVLFYTALEVEFTLVSAVDGSSHTVTALGEAFDSGDKSFGKAQSYAYKGMAFMLFAIPVEGQDNDPDANSHEIKKPEPVKITVDQAITLRDLFTHAKAYNEQAFCKQAQIKKLEDLQADRYEGAFRHAQSVIAKETEGAA